MKDIRKGVGHSITLPRDYRSKKEIEVVLLEITEEVCRRARSLSKVGRVVNVYCRGADFDFPTGFPDRSNVGAYSCNNGRLSVRAKSCFMLIGIANQ